MRDDEAMIKARDIFPNLVAAAAAAVDDDMPNEEDPDAFYEGEGFALPHETPTRKSGKSGSIGTK